jgi:hypothetical protein
MKLYKYILPLMLLYNWSCTSPIEDIESKNNNNIKLTIVSGNNQSGQFGEILKDTIILKVTSKLPSKGYKITFECIQGNGKLIYNGGNNTIMADSLGEIRFFWRVGGDNAVQKVRFYVYADSIKSTYGGYYYDTFSKIPSDSITIVSTSDKPKGWGLSCGLDDNIDFFSSDFLSFDNETIYLVNRHLYYSTDGGVNWYKKNNIPGDPEISFARFDSKGWLYLATKNNGIMYSKNLNTWKTINTGILDYRDPTMFLVEDSTLFVSFYFDGPYRTTDNGRFWRKLIVGGDTQRCYFMKRHPDGRLFMFDNWTTFLMSENNGDNWKSVNINSNYTNSIVYDLQIDPNGTIYIGADDATFSAIDSHSFTGYYKYYYQWNSNSQSVERIKRFNNNIYYLVRSTPTPGIYSVNNNWNRIELGFTKPIYNYYLKSDNTFILISNAGCYYFNGN